MSNYMRDFRYLSLVGLKVTCTKKGAYNTITSDKDGKLKIEKGTELVNLPVFGNEYTITYCRKTDNGIIVICLEGFGDTLFHVHNFPIVPGQRENK